MSPSSRQPLILPLLLAVLVFSQAALASLTLLPSQTVLPAFDAYWAYRAQRVYNVTGNLTGALTILPGCIVNSTSTVWQTDIVVVHFPDVSSVESVGGRTPNGCRNLAQLTQELSKTYQSTPFAALLVTWNDPTEAGNDYATPWGIPSLLNDAPFQLSLAPRPTYDAVMNATRNLTKPMLAILVNEMDPWTGLSKGTASVIYLSFFSLFLAVFFGYASYLHIQLFRSLNKCVVNIKTAIYISIQITTAFQILASWVPMYPISTGSVFFWYSYLFGFIGYSLVLLTWVRVVSHDRNGKTAISKYVAKGMHIFTYIAMVIFFFITTSAIISQSFPQIEVLQTIRTAFYYMLPIVLISQAVLFLYHGIRLITVLKTFTTTEDKRILMRKMSILMSVAVVMFFLTAVMAIINIVFNRIISGRWAARVIRDVAMLCLIVVIFFTLNTSRSAKMSSSQTGSSNAKHASAKSTSVNGGNIMMATQKTSASVVTSELGDDSLDETDDVTSRSTSNASAYKFSRTISSTAPMVPTNGVGRSNSTLQDQIPVPALPNSKTEAKRSSTRHEIPEDTLVTVVGTFAMKKDMDVEDA